MPPQRKVSMRQMEILLEFAESHRHIALGRSSGGPFATRTNWNLWASAAAQLNKVADGVKKTPDQWRRYWIEFKAKTKMKAGDSRRNTAAMGMSKLVPFSPVEERVLAIMSSAAADRLPKVLPEAEGPSTSTNDVNTSTTTVISLPLEEMQEEWLDSEETIAPVELSTPDEPSDPIELSESTSSRGTQLEQLVVSSRDDNRKSSWLPVIVEDTQDNTIMAPIKKENKLHCNSEPPSQHELVCQDCENIHRTFDNASDSRNKLFGHLLAEEFKLIKPCFRTRAYAKILKFLNEARGCHSSQVTYEDD